MRLIAVVSLITLALAAPAAAVHKPKHHPKPTAKAWQWTAVKASTRLTAAAPFVWDEAELQESTCVGRGKHVRDRYSAFVCKIEFGNSNMSQPYGASLLVRILPIRTGKLCVPTGADGMAVSPAGATAGVRVAEGRSCP